MTMKPVKTEPPRFREPPQEQATGYSGADRHMISTELANAQRSLERVFRAATGVRDMTLAKSMRDTIRTLGDRITAINGGPIKIAFRDLIS